MNAVHRVATVVLTSSVVLALAACGPTATPDITPDATPDDGGRTGTTAPATSAPVDPPTGSPSSSPQTTPPSAQEDGMRIELSVSDQRFQATLDDSAAARDLVAQLPLTLEMGDHGSMEKTGPLPARLSLEGQPAGADPDVGDVGYYAPGNDLVLYYGDQSYYNGIVVLGRMHGDAAQHIATMDGSITATITTLDN